MNFKKINFDESTMPSGCFYTTGKKMSYFYFFVRFCPIFLFGRCNYYNKKIDLKNITLQYIINTKNV